MLVKIVTKKRFKVIAMFLAVNLLAQIGFPTVAFALTSGPSQPEMGSFEPVNTNQMVDLFSGDFTYNIPLMNVPGPNGGYPINLAYHAGIGMEQEASWVGLGWNINAGVINRGMRGVPDDFSGDNITKTVHMKPQRKLSFTASAGLGNFEIFGVDPKVGVSVGGSYGVYYDNYKGVGTIMGIGFSATSAEQKGGSMQVGLGFTSDSQEGLGINPSVGYGNEIKNNAFSFETSFNFNSRQGLTGITFKSSMQDANDLKEERSLTPRKEKKLKNNHLMGGGTTGSGSTFSSSTYVPLMDMPRGGFGISFGMELGGEVFGLNNNPLHLDVAYNQTDISSNTVAFGGYGYLYAEKNTEGHNIADFNREKDIPVNKNSKSLPIPSATFDVFSVKGQGVGGAFRTYRADIGVFKDPRITGGSTGFGLGPEVGVGSGVKVGVNPKLSLSDSYSGPWTSHHGEITSKYVFQNLQTNDSYEPSYFKALGETVPSQKMSGGSQNTNEEPFRFEIGLSYKPLFSAVPSARNLVNTGSSTQQYVTAKTNYREKRVQSIEYLNYGELDGLKKYQTTHTNFTNTHGSAYYRFTSPNIYDYSERSDHHIGQLSVVNPDGNRYVYALPAYNTLQRDVMFSVDGNGVSTARKRSYTTGDNTTGNNKGLSNLFSRTEMAPYAHSYLLTEVLSPDYVDLTGDGPTDDDLGYWVKFNYIKRDNYQWRAPYEEGMGNNIENNYSNEMDDMSGYSYGTKEILYLESIETKTHVAEYYMSERLDGLGVVDENGGKGNDQELLKLDKIVLKSKADLNKAIKTVHFEYDYTLCVNIPNHASFNGTSGPGKLTLKKVWFTYFDNIAKGALSPYEFTYAVNPSYDIDKMDRWGNYQAVGPFTDSDGNNATEYVEPEQQFPYCNQFDDYTNNTSHAVNNTRAEDASAWNLTKIVMPSRGELNINYEADDYAYVQNLPAMQMFKIIGTGNATDELKTSAPLSNNDDRIYIELPKVMNQTELTNCISGVDEVYFKSYMHLKDKANIMQETAEDYVEGYMKMVDNPSYGNDFGFGANNQQAWFRIKKVPTSFSVDVHPIKMAGLREIRYNRVDLLSGQNDDMGAISSAVSIISVVPLVLGTITNTMQMLSGFYNYGVLAGWCDYIKIDDRYPSYVRLKTPSGKKYGGGCRVKSVILDDNWNDLIGSNYAASTYGQEYTYTLEDGTTSSGVAEYEPLIGGEENPFRRPVRYASDRLIIKDEALMVEEPFNENLFPMASVGYSRVTVKNITQNDGSNDIKKAVSGVTVNEFYTARDFPVYTKKTDVDYEGYNRIIPIPFIGSRTYHNNGYSQGYSIELNNMHGKPYSVATYAPPVSSSEPQIGDPRVKPIAATYYYYKTKEPFVRFKSGGNVLDNSVTVLTGDALISTTEIGKHIDTYVDMRENKSSAKSFELLPNLNVGYFYFAAMLMMFMDESQSMFRSVTTNKVITRNGILDHQITTKEGARTVTQNLYYDAETGSPLLTTTTNDFDKPIYDYTYAAHWEHEGMRGAYQNVGAVVSTSTSSLVRPGDELLKLSDNSKYWVEEDGSLKDEDGITQTPSGDFKIIRSGYRNQQSVPMGSIISLTNPVTGRAFPMFDAINLATKVTPNPSAIITSEDNVNFDDCFTHQQVDIRAVNIDPINQLNILFYENEACEAHINILFPSTVDLTDPLEFDVTTMVLTKHGATLVKAVDGNGNTIWGELINGECLNECLDGVLHASSAKFNSSWDIDYVDAGVALPGPIAVPLNTTRYGADNIWRLHETFLFSVKRKQSTGTNPHQTQTGIDGTYDNFALFNWSSSATNVLWTPTNTINKYSPYGYELENEDALGINSSAMYGYNNSVVTAVASNTSYNEIVFDGFEEYDGTSYTYPSSLDGNYGHIEWTPSGSLATLLTTDEAHSGNVSVKIADTENIEFSNSLTSPSAGKFLPQASKDYYFSAWVKVQDNAATTATLKVDGNTISTSTYNTQRIEGWQRLEGKFTTGTTSITIKIEAAGGTVYVDDVRIQPFRSAMKTYVYDTKTLWLKAELDDRNYATFYNYDEEGNLVQIKKETKDGVRTIVSNRKNVSQ